MATHPMVEVRWYTGVSVGRVALPGEVAFGYDDEWLRTGWNLSPLKVPFTKAAYRAGAEAFDFLPGFLSDCLPDDWGNRIMFADLERAKVRPTPLAKLAWVGRRAIGALYFEPVFDERGAGVEWEQATAALLAKEAVAVQASEPPEAFRLLRAGGSPGGALPKATVAKLRSGNLVVGGDVRAIARAFPEARMGILKLDAPRAAGGRVTDGRLEHAYMLMANAAGIRTATTEVLTDNVQSGVRHHLFVERFDCRADLAKRLHVVTLAGILESYNLTYRSLLSATSRLTHDQRQVQEAVRRMIFNVRSGNRDDHGKNHAFQFDHESGDWALTPAYDLTLNADTGGRYHGLSVSTFGELPRLDDVRGVATAFGVDDSAFRTLDDAVRHAISQWSTFADRAALPESEANRARAVHEGIEASLSAHGKAGAPRPRKRKVWE